MKVKPYQISASAWFRKDKLYVHIELDSEGKYYVRTGTAGGQHAGDYIPDPDKLDEYHDFVKDCLDSFKELIHINKTAFVGVTNEGEQS